MNLGQNIIALDKKTHLPGMRYRPRKVTMDFTGEKTMTEQSHAKLNDLHHLMKLDRDRLAEHTNIYEGKYMDMINVPDFHQAQLILAETASMWESIPATLRQKFNNEPERFVEFMQNEDNRESMLEMGLSDTHLPPLPEEPTPTPTPAPEPTPEPTPEL